VIVPANGWLKENINLLGGVCSIATVAPTLWGFIRQLVTPTTVSAIAAGPGRLLTILVIGGLAAAAHGVLWSGTELAFGWQFEAGGHELLPSGWSAIALSVTQTLPLVALPVLYQAFSGVRIVPANHVIAGVVAIAAAAVGNLVMYGAGSSFKGLRRRLAPGLELTRGRAIALEALWATMHFGCTAVVYRAVVSAPHFSIPAVWAAPVWGGAAFFFGMVRPRAEIT
jgi:hypothetical protein